MAPKTARVDVGAAMAEYLRQNPRSSAMSERASAVMPGGTHSHHGLLSAVPAHTGQR